MDADDVARLARHEQRMWSSEDASTTPVPAAGPGAYVPLGGGLAPGGPRPPRVEFRGAAALGATLAFRFGWPGDEQDRDLLLLLDFAAHPGDVTAASTWLLEYVEQRVHHDTSWFPRDVVPVSDRVAVVRAARQPGRR
jgi:hypothetical protein